MWQEPLYQRLRGNPYPLFAFADGIIPAASVWSGARLWTKAFREAGLRSGDRLLLALEPSPAFVQVLVAGLWEGLTLVLAPPPKSETILAALMEETDARASVSCAGENTAGVFWPDGCEGPGGLPRSLRVVRHAATPDVRFLLKTSGTTTGQGKWIALSDENVWSVLQSHGPLLALPEAGRVLSFLPWHHAFGLFIDLLPALFAGCEIIRDPQSGRNPPALLALGKSEGVQYLCSVPLVLDRLRHLGGGEAFLRSLCGGVVGGAPVDANLAAFLAQTNLRAGYGQTEASPGIALGKSGEWPSANFLGRAVGCETRIGAGGVLEYRGKNVHIGCWTPANGFQTNLGAHGWFSSGDLAGGAYINDSGDGGLVWRGRNDDAFKMANGRRVEAGECETVLVTNCPPVLDALLHSPDGRRLVWYLHLSPGASPSDLPLENVLGTLGPLLSTAYDVPSATWARTAKGTVDRRATLARLAPCGSDGLHPAATKNAHPLFIGC